MNRIVVDELIGRKVKVVDSKCITYIGLGGIVVDETMNTLIIKNRNKEIVVPKKGSTFLFDGKHLIKGTFINFRHIDRIKKLKNKV